MISSYDPNFSGTHVVRVTFMQWDYIGHVAYRVGGNCKGADLLNADFLDYDNQIDIDGYLENDCQLTYHDDAEYFTAVLSKPDGDQLEVDGDSEEFKRMIVSMEFVELK